MSVESTSDLSRTMLCSHLEFYFVPKEAVIVQRRVLLDISLKLLGTSGSSTGSTRATRKVAGPCAALVARRLMGFGQLCTNRG